MDTFWRNPAIALLGLVVVVIVVALIARARRRRARPAPPLPPSAPAPGAAYLDSSHIIEGPIVGGAEKRGEPER